MTTKLEFQSNCRKEEKLHLDSKFKELDESIKSIKSTESHRFKETSNVLKDVILNLNEVKTVATERRSLSEQKDIIPFDKLVSNHALKLPLENRKAFEDFEAKLTDSKELAEDLVRISIIILFSNLKKQILKYYFK